MDILLASTVLVAVAETGDKTQLLSFVLAARLRRPAPIIWGILAATAANHALAAAAGVWTASLLSAATVRWITAAAFVAFGLWALVPDRYDAAGPRASPSVFLTTLVAFFIAEMGDKTQFATIALGARYESVWTVTVGTTLGMMIANVPAVLIGEKLAARLKMDLVRRTAAGLFFLTALLALFGPA